MKITKWELIHPFMFGIFPILFIYANNLSEISLNSLIFPVVLIFGILTILILFFSKISKNLSRVTLALSFSLLLFFSIGYVKISFHGIKIFNFAIDQIGFVILLYAIVFFVGIFIIYKIKYLSEITKIVSVISVAVILSFLPGMIIDSTGNEFNANNFYSGIKFVSLEKPNIYFIILDSYPNQQSLTNHFNFDNSEFLEYLKNLGFVISEDSFSNYGGTGYTMISTFHMNYLHDLDEFNANNSMLKKNMFSNNPVMKTFQENGYTTIYIDGGGPMRDMQVNKIFCHSFDNGLLQTLIDTSVVTYIYQGFFWDSWNEIRSCAFSELDNIKENTQEPFFVYAHLRTPHEPYLRDADGNFVQYEERVEELDEKTSNERFVYQLQYTNKIMSEIINKLLLHESKPIIILASDTGWNPYLSSPPTDEDLIQLYSNFAAFYLPGIDNHEPYRTITPVNIFRIILNDYYGNDLDILENKAYFVNIENTEKDLDQIDITNIVNSKK